MAFNSARDDADLQKTKRSTNAISAVTLRLAHILAGHGMNLSHVKYFMGARTY